MMCWPSYLYFKQSLTEHLKRNCFLVAEFQTGAGDDGSIWGQESLEDRAEKQSHSLYQVVRPDSFLEFQAQNSFRI